MALDLTDDVYLETAIVFRELKEGTAIFGTDHTSCDDRCHVIDITDMEKSGWRRSQTAEFNGFVQKQTWRCRCNRKYRLRIPLVLVVEARLR